MILLLLSSGFSTTSLLNFTELFICAQLLREELTTNKISLSLLRMVGLCVCVYSNFEYLVIATKKEIFLSTIHDVDIICIVVMIIS